MLVTQSDLDALIRGFEAPTRGEQVHLALTSLRDSTMSTLIVIAELAYEMHNRRWWAEIRDPLGKIYQTEERYMEDVLGVRSYRSALRRIAIGRVLAKAPEAQRDELRGDLADLGLAKAAVLAPALEAAYKPQDGSKALAAGYPSDWLAKARVLPAEELQRVVSDELRSKPRGRAPGSSLEKYLTQRLGSIERAAVVGEFFRLGNLIAPGATAAEVLSLGMAECIATWEPAVAHRGEAGVTA